jgi:single-stranded-DNA-specific exonuclease
MQKRWVYKTTPDPATVDTLVKALNIPASLAELLAQRGVVDFESAKSFFRPSLSDLLDPFLMRDMDKAVQRIEIAMTNREKILIYGDYDVDGTTSVALVYGFLQTYHPHLNFYLPNRQREGYGISTEGVQWAKENGYSLVIALDCGIKSVEVLKYAQQLGIDFIICDHHLAGDELPPAYAILDPKRADCSYPYKELSGCGIGFKLMQAFCQHNALDVNRLYDFIDLVGVSIASDLVPITGENRTLAYYGFQKLNSEPRIGLKALMEISGFTVSNNIMNVSNIVFAIGPRINAVGRLGHAADAVKLLVAQSKSEADQYASLINNMNLERKDLDAIATQAIEILEQEAKKGINRSSTVIFNPSWHKGIIGIIAARCIDHCHRPTVILTATDQQLVGSARSVPGFNLYEAIECCAGLLIQYGGHKQAAGLTIKLENLDAFANKFEEVVNQTIDKEMLIPIQEIDLDIALSVITPKFYRILSQMAPFGPENMRPVFLTKNTPFIQLRLLKEKHLKFKIPDANGHPAFEVVGFGMAHLYHDLMQAKLIDLCYTIEENHFQGKTTLQLRAKDIRIVAQ